MRLLVKKLIIVLLFCLYTLPHDYSVQCSETKTDLQTTSSVLDIDSHTLCPSFGFYKGSKDMSLVRSIVFSQESPDQYDECWSANITGTDEVRGYLVGDSVIVVGECIYTNKRCSYMFAAHNSYGDPLWSSLSSIEGLEMLNTSLTENMKMMFAFCKLTELKGIEEWDVSRVENFAGMFQGHDNTGDVRLKFIDVSQWDTSSARNMSHVFYGCSLLEYVPVENWDVSNVATFSHMFADCYNLKKVDFSEWETSSVESFDAFLNDCRSLVEVDVSGLDTSTCKQFSQMFESCTSLRRIVGLDKWNVSSASCRAFSETFHCCYNLEEVDVGEWVSSPDDTSRMFKNCYNLTRVDISGFDMTNTKTKDEMFMNCKSLKEIIQ